MQLPNLRGEQAAALAAAIIAASTVGVDPAVRPPSCLQNSLTRQLITQAA